MPSHPLAEVFGFPTDNFSSEAIRHRAHRLCPFNNKVPNCTKDKANDPLGVCSVFDEQSSAVITCPVRFRQRWLIAEHAAAFFFPANQRWTSLTEVRLKDRADKAAGNIDVVLVAYDDHGRVLNFGSLEIQAVYISGNVRRPFEHYMNSPRARASFDWSNEIHYPNPDYLSSSRKRLAPQLIYKGQIFRAWRKKMAVALNRGFFHTLPKLPTTPRENADMAWFIYDLEKNCQTNVFELRLYKTVFTRSDVCMRRISKPEPGRLRDFKRHLQDLVDEKLDNGHAPTNRTLDELVDL
jgi:hypothetical protein